ncbi:ComK protein [Alkalibacterium subtropicum]|uniref:ComK protein n=1 Tax=Alkalibacterium subtropicum TaxID=753702 RepID=A0A1I1KHW0_9LACT|nr:competence protein ComK [Alkalibacterium subtropicum]SFC57713.1 ComK protein [Alkalibacterium subtropicum]
MVQFSKDEPIHIYRDLTSFYTNSLLHDESPPYVIHSNLYQSKRTLEINAETLSRSLNEAIEQQHLLISRHSFYIYDLSSYPDCEYNTLVFQLSGEILKSKETTSKIMKRYFDYCRVDYGFVKQFGKTLGINQRCPYVVGETMFVPVKGTAKNHSSWIAFHHVLYYEEQVASQLTCLKIRQLHELTLPFPRKKVDDMFMKTSRLYHTTKALSRDLQNMFAPFYEESRYEDLNIVKKELTSVTAGHPPLSLVKIFDYMSLHRANDMLQTVLGEDNPYLDEIKARFPYSLLFK